MTDKEKAIVMAYTGICMLTGDKFQTFHKYVDDLMGRSIMTHEMGLLGDTIKRKARADFTALCADDRSVADGSREDNMKVLKCIKSDLWMEGMNMTGEYQGVWVRFRDIERIIDKYMKESEARNETGSEN